MRGRPASGRAQNRLDHLELPVVIEDSYVVIGDGLVAFPMRLRAAEPRPPERDAQERDD